MFCHSYLGIFGWLLQGLHLSLAYLIASQRHNTRCGRLQRTGTSPAPGTGPSGHRSHGISLLVSLPFCESQKIPQQLVFHLQPGDLFLVFFFAAQRTFSGPSLWLGRYPCGYPFLPAVIAGHPCLDLPLCQAKMFCDLPPCFAFLPHLQNYGPIFLYMCILPFSHNNTPCCSYSPTTGGLLSTVYFLWGIATHGGHGEIRCCALLKLPPETAN